MAKDIENDFAMVFVKNKGRRLPLRLCGEYREIHIRYEIDPSSIIYSKVRECLKDVKASVLGLDYILARWGFYGLDDKLIYVIKGLEYEKSIK